MASITFDGQSFLLDGRRIWLVSGSIHMARTPRATWARRIHQAKQAGLNCIETPVVWARHEPRKGQFDFTGENDVREFVKLVQAAGMYCILRPGPYVDNGYDLGGLPPWLIGLENQNGPIRLRANSQLFLEACSRYITALADQVRALQVNAPAPKGSSAAANPGPIVLLQNECHWTCGDDQLADTYLAELDRYYREAGFSVPIVNSNDLWQSVEGEIDGWTGYEGLLGHLRQLGSVRPAQPRIVIEFKVGDRTVFGQPAPERKSPLAVERRLGEILASGGQFNIDPFFGGSNPGFLGGRDALLGPGAMVTTSAGAGAPIDDTGHDTELSRGIRRICTFASRFQRVLSHLDPARQAVALAPEPARPEAAKDKPGTHPGLSVIHCVGSQGGVVFVFGDETGTNPRPGTLLLADGSTLPVDLRGQSVLWCLLDVRLTGRANLDYSNLSALTLVGKVLVVFGAPGARGVLSVNGSPLETTVPTDKPALHEHEGLTIVVASAEHVEHIHADDRGVYIGVAGLDAEGRPIPHADHKTYTHVDAEGKKQIVRALPAPTPKRTRATLGEWTCFTLDPYCTGTSPRFANIQKPADLVALGAAYGYGWYRLKITSHAPRKSRLMFPYAGHRLHIMTGGEPVGLVGIGPGASTSLVVPLGKGATNMVILAENAGRVSSGNDLGESVGLYGHAFEVEPIKTPKPKLVASDPVDALAFRAPLWRMQRDDRTDAQRLTWTIKHLKKTPIIMQIGAFSAGTRQDGVVLLNNKIIHVFQSGGGRPIVINADLLTKGNNEIQIALMASTAEAADELAKAVQFFDAEEGPTVKAEWAFAKWEVPGAEVFAKAGKSGASRTGKPTPGCPAWWHATLDAGEGDQPVLLDLSGLTKGQLYVNGQHVGRYFVATGAGKKVPPQTRYLIPRHMLKAGPSDIMIFDEHGASPTRVKVVSDVNLGPIDC